VPARLWRIVKGNALDTNAQRKQLTIAGILLGLGLGGFFDGIALHQILQWHHMLTSTGDYPANTVAGLEVNTLWDGLFHASTYIFVVAGLLVLWNAALKQRRRKLRSSDGWEILVCGSFVARVRQVASWSRSKRRRRLYDRASFLSTGSQRETRMKAENQT
jgi:hypothetical protein